MTKEACYGRINGSGVMCSYTTGPGFKTRQVKYTTEPLTDCHQNSIASWCVWKVRKDSPFGSDPKHLNG